MADHCYAPTSPDEREATCGQCGRSREACEFRGPRFTAMGDLVAVHYPGGVTIGDDALSALASALVIARWHADNERHPAVVAWRRSEEGAIVTAVLRGRAAGDEVPRG